MEAPKPSDENTAAENLRQQRQDRLLWFYERVRRLSDIVPPVLDSQERPQVPTFKHMRAVEAETHEMAVSSRFVRHVLDGRDLDVAFINVVADLAGIEKTWWRALTLAQAVQRQEKHRVKGDVAMAVVAHAHGVEDSAWELLLRVPMGEAVRLAPELYVGLALTRDRALGVEAFDELLTQNPELDPEVWLALGKQAFIVEEEARARQAFQRARASSHEASDPQEMERSITWSESWLGRRDQARLPVASPEGTVPFALLDYEQPDESHSSRNLGDYIQTIASMGHLVRQRGFTFSGDAEAVRAADQLRDRVKPERVIDGASANLHLLVVNRDASNYQSIPDGTWTLAFGWYMHPQFRRHFDFPFNPAIRPIFVSFHVHAPAMLTDEAIDYLKRYAPIGCRDWNTVHLLQAAGVPAFFSGCITTTIDTVFPEVDVAQRSGDAYVDTEPTGPGEVITQIGIDVRHESFGKNIPKGLDYLERLRTDFEKVYTSRLHSYLPGRSIGAPMEFRPKNAADPRFDGLAFISDDEFDQVRDGILNKVSDVLGLIGAGAPEEVVYARWREVCADDVAAAEQRLHSDEVVAPLIAVESVCDSIRRQAVTIERSKVDVSGDEIVLEFSLDENFKHQLEVVLTSIVEKASRPLKAYVLCRGLTDEDFRQISSIFPTVSFVWLPTDQAQYGQIDGMLRHITVATMDRLLLPELLPEVERIVHFDLDALCRADIAELYDLDLQGNPIAARTSPQPKFRSGFRGIILCSRRLKDRPEMARELIRRTHRRHSFDFLGFNAGVMVLDLDRMRRDGFCQEFLPYVERYGMNDQDVLNAYAGAQRTEISSEWNLFPRLESIDNAKAVHWAGSVKPWDGSGIAGTDLWEAAVHRLEEVRASAAKV